jgi:hypothetical protein
MKSFLIDGLSKKTIQIKVTDRAGIASLIGFSSVADEIISEAEIAVFDEDCFICGSEGRFQTETLAPIAGKAVVVGVAGSDLVDSQLTSVDLRLRVKFL